MVAAALHVGFTHIDTANDYNNQRGVGAALDKVKNRSSYFLTTKVPAQISARSAYAKTLADLGDNLDQLGLAFVDLVLVHFPPPGNVLFCAAMQEQWRALEAFYHAGKARSIGVSNYCESSLDCILSNASVVPAVNQIKYHVGMSADPRGIKSYCDEKGIVTQAYSPLGDGTTELISGPLVDGIGKAHGKTGAQVSLRWIYRHGVPLSTKSTSATHLGEDLDALSDSWELTDAEMTTLDGATSPKGQPSFACVR